MPRSLPKRTFLHCSKTNEAIATKLGDFQAISMRHILSYILLPVVILDAIGCCDPAMLYGVTWHYGRLIFFEFLATRHVCCKFLVQL